MENPSAMALHLSVLSVSETTAVGSDPLKIMPNRRRGSAGWAHRRKKKWGCASLVVKGAVRHGSGLTAPIFALVPLKVCLGSKQGYRP